MSALWKPNPEQAMARLVAFWERRMTDRVLAEFQVPNAAWQYIRDFTANETAAFIASYPGIPLMKKDIGLFLTDENKSYGWDKIPDIIADPKNIRVPGAGAKFDKIAGLVQAELDLVFTGDKSAQAAAETASPLVDEELARETS